MTTKCKKSVIDKLIVSKRKTVLAGRYLASGCQASLTKKAYGIEEMERIQQFYDIEFPNTYRLIAYKKKTNDRYEKVFNGNENNKTTIRIFSVQNDFFGFIGKDSKFDEWKNKNALFFINE